jgi:hypothetical protein
MTYYLSSNQTEIPCEESERLSDVIRAAETLSFGVRIENIRTPQDDGSEVVSWMVTRFEDVPGYEDWDGRYVDDEDAEPDAQ